MIEKRNKLKEWIWEIYLKNKGVHFQEDYRKNKIRGIKFWLVILMHLLPLTSVFYIIYAVLLVFYMVQTSSFRYIISLLPLLYLKKIIVLNIVSLVRVYIMIKIQFGVSRNEK